MHQPAHDSALPDPRLLVALEAHDGSPSGHAEVLAALVDARVYAAITATATSEHVEEGTGLRAESSAEMAVVLLAGADGSRALPVFTDPAAMKRWRLDVRPVPMSGPEAAQAAGEQGAVALVLNARVTVTELAVVARGWVPVAGTGLSTRHADTELRPASDVPAALVTALRAALVGEPLRSARVLAGPDGLVLGVAPRADLDPAALAALAHRVMTRLGDALPAEGLDLAQVAAKGPGQELLKRGLLRR